MSRKTLERWESYLEHLEKEAELKDACMDLTYEGVMQIGDWAYAAACVLKEKEFDEEADKFVLLEKKANGLQDKVDLKRRQNESRSVQ